MEVEEKGNGLYKAFEPYKDDVVHKGKTEDINEVNDRASTRDSFASATQLLHQQTILTKQMKMVI